MSRRALHWKRGEIAIRLFRRAAAFSTVLHSLETCPIASTNSVGLEDHTRHTFLRASGRILLTNSFQIENRAGFNQRIIKCGVGFSTHFPQYFGRPVLLPPYFYEVPIARAWRDLNGGPFSLQSIGLRSALRPLWQPQRSSAYLLRLNTGKR
jgi:hypothetical protein